MQLICNAETPNFLVMYILEKIKFKFLAPCFCHCCEHKFTQGHHPSCWHVFFVSNFCLFSLVLNYCEGVDMLREAGIDMNYDEDLRYVKG